MSQLIEKDPDAGKDWRQKEMRAAEDEIDSITDSVDMDLSKLWEMMKNRETWLQSMGSQRVGHNLVTEQAPPPL